MTTDPVIYDLRGMNCPLPVLKTRKHLRSMQIGEMVWVRTSDPLAVIDIPNYCQEQGHTLVSSESMDDGHRFLIKKTA